ncbi:hypothetical protein FB451DRAFT_1186211 [Mycena latifolia]|nr:hypothetical protein FB451DRAFT_1186211 [Mycena latifolia]
MALRKEHRIVGWVGRTTREVISGKNVEDAEERNVGLSTTLRGTMRCRNMGRVERWDSGVGRGRSETEVLQSRTDEHLDIFHLVSPDECYEIWKDVHHRTLLVKKPEHCIALESVLVPKRNVPGRAECRLGDKPDLGIWQVFSSVPQVDRQKTNQIPETANLAPQGVQCWLGEILACQSKTVEVGLQFHASERTMRLSKKDFSAARLDRVPNELWLEILQILPRIQGRPAASVRIGRRTLLGAPEFLVLRRNSPVCSLLYCSISPWSSRTRKDLALSPTDAPYILLDALFERLACFTGLQRHRADSVHFTQASVETICRLPTLSELSVTHCGVAPGERIIPSSRTLRVSSFCIRPKVEVELEHGDGHWIPLLHPDHLHKLNATFSPRVLGRAVHAIPSFPRVHELAANLKLPTPSENILILSKFPAVQALSIYGKDILLEDPGLQPRTPTFPLLREYTGSYKNFPVFLPVSTLTRLTTPSCNPSNFIMQIQGIKGPNNITTLHATFTSFNSTTFHTLVELFPQLFELQLDIVLPTEDHLFQDHLYSNFHKISKEGMIVDGRFGSLSAYKLPDFGQLRDALTTKCPALTWLRLDGYYYFY